MATIEPISMVGYLPYMVVTDIQWTDFGQNSGAIILVQAA
jgi:hypothetical protein